MKMNVDRRTALALQAVLGSVENPDLDGLRDQVDKIVARPPDPDTFLTVTDMDALLDVLPQALPSGREADTPNQRQVRESALPKLRRKVDQIKAKDAEPRGQARLPRTAGGGPGWR